MFRTLAKKFLPNPLDWHLKRLAKRGGKKVLLGWNRGLGDIALGLYAIVERIREFVPDAEITFVTRHNLMDGFSMLEGVKAIIDPHWSRGESCRIDPELKKNYDLVIEKPSPTDWVYWQRGKVVPKLKWDPHHDSLYERFDLPPNCIGVQTSAESGYAAWRDWPEERWRELFERLGDQPVLLFGFGAEPQFHYPNVIDLRGKTTLFELLSIIKHRVRSLILPDSGISSIVYYLNESFPIRHISLWSDPNQGILKQAVASPNPQLSHYPLIARNKDLSSVTVDAVLSALKKNVLPILLAGGQGTRLGVKGPKGLFEIGGKTLFDWFCEKLPKNIPLAVMTSPLNHDETVAYFKKFDLEVFFFQQEMSPLKPTGELAPNGNGNVFRAFKKAGLDDLFAKRGINCVTINYVDNPLNRPLDPKLFENLEEVAIQCIEREESDRSMGVLVEREGKIEVVEYTELDPAQTYKYAYSGQLAFDFSFFCKMGEKELPIHWVQKGEVWKGEQFIFDCLKYAEKVRPVCVDRKTHYAPIKGPESVAKALKSLVKG
ncbi:MAG: UTP--glucose-1-phosphate uridylyltransferase [Parachlamydiales bacterium]|nr:UTP--glucose-1-phosphate uridylyltransferase [Parachlamydiales bacterium]